MNISETLISVVQMPSREKLNMFSTAQDSVIAKGKNSIWGNRGTGPPALLYSACAAAARPAAAAAAAPALLLHGVSVTDRRCFFSFLRCTCMCFRVSRQHHMVLPVCASPIYRRSSRHHHYLKQGCHTLVHCLYEEFQSCYFRRHYRDQ